MLEKMRKEAYWAALVAIAGEYLEINSFEQTGHKLVYIRMLRVTDIANALEQAYKMGLGVGYNVNEHQV
jgi:glucose-6-phosphate isomerase